jgi:radical SAM superfamily enzyme YgiQ (UPF0313 family)
VADADLCLLTTSIVCHETELAAVGELRKRSIPVAAIGPFGNAVPDPYIAAGAWVIAGEPEMFFHRFDRSIEEWNRLGPVLQAERDVDLDELAHPAWDILPPALAPRMGFLAGTRTVVPILSSRGCPYSCFHYCTYPMQQGRRLRKRSPDKVVAEMAHWQDTRSVNAFIFRDPVFGLDRAHALALCEAVQRSGRTFRFGVECHLKSVDEELAERLHAAGARLIVIV